MTGDVISIIRDDDVEYDVTTDDVEYDVTTDDFVVIYDKVTGMNPLSHPT